MKVLKRNQIIVLVIALMLVSAGYLNYTANTQTNTTIPTSVEEGIEYAGIGDAKLVSSNGIVNTNTQEAIVENNSISIEENAIVENIAEETKNTNATTTDEYFSSSKLNRESMYSQMIESYQKILENDSISSDQKAIAQTEIKNINDTKNRIMICENLIKTKGIKDVVMFVNDKSISVVIKSESLQEEQIAQIQNIIEREMQTEISNIHISTK